GCENGETVTALPSSPRMETPQKPIPTPKRVIEAPNEALPADLPVSPDILRLVETHPFFANAPPVLVDRYQISSNINSITTGNVRTSSTSDYNENMSVRWLRQGLTTLSTANRYTVNNNGSIGTYSTESKSLDVLNGLFSLSYRTTNTSGSK